MDEAKDRRLDGWSWAIFFVRWALGLIFFMAGWWKTFDLGPLEHARRLFIVPYADTWLPAWLLWASGTVIPVVELVAGALMCLGLRIREAGIAFGFILIVVDYGHLLKEPLFDTTHHIFPRLVLLAFVLADALTEKFGADSVEELQANWRAFRDRTSARFARS